MLESAADDHVGRAPSVPNLARTHRVRDDGNPRIELRNLDVPSVAGLFRHAVVEVAKVRIMEKLILQLVVYLSRLLARTAHDRNVRPAVVPEDRPERVRVNKDLFGVGIRECREQGVSNGILRVAYHRQMRDAEAVLEVVGHVEEHESCQRFPSEMMGKKLVLVQVLTERLAFLVHHVCCRGILRIPRRPPGESAEARDLRSSAEIF